jgi:putative sugar O-methyltransferase
VFKIHAKLVTIFLTLMSLQCSVVNAVNETEFREWWLSYRQQAAIPQRLTEMVDYFVDSPSFKNNSNFWHHLNKRNIEQITTLGYENFKQSVAQNYFTWVVTPNHPYALNLIKMINNRSLNLVRLPPQEIHKKHEHLSQQQSSNYNYITSLLLSYIVQYEHPELLVQLEEPASGNPLCVNYNGIHLSQDSLNSLLEFSAINKNCPLEKISRIVEVGAGSGRTAFCFLRLIPNLKYIIVDIPPALYLSQKYLTEAFPTKKRFLFQPFDHFEDIKSEFDAAELIFLTPEQMELLPNQSADLFLAIDCLHEMKPDMIQLYFQEAERLSPLIYFKCWQDTTVPFDGYHYSINNYPVPSSWTLLFKEPCLVPSDFFHAFYKTR